ncbi:GntR family transcriptional regulator [Clostridium gasigenes]|uniref:GntR family transcriptional regulator n=1 Tax=Clostridium gasigenes TaxID=94869 RepID=UPI001C0C24EA|nr:GntR family transcriptional regulator [Clostridium gasigenes]MBU3138171.1 GntR family transcriptional regulator [Clostridium gasigenes]
MRKNNLSNKKVLKYIDIHNKLLKLIQDGIYPEDSKLPSEPELAKIMEISRTTLRQSLLLLQEDGIIHMKHGQGNFVCKPLNKESVGLEKKTNPIYKCYVNEVDSVDVEFRVGVSNDYIKLILKRDIPLVAAVERYYKTDDKICAHGFTVIPSDTLDKYNIDLKKDNELLNFLENELYEFSHSTSLEIKYIKESEFLKKCNIDSPSHTYVLIIENVFDKTGSIIVNNKFFIPIENSYIKINTYEDRYR